ncbi:MAG: biotin/lipoyl-binding protein [SAR324 cluster bacterium]|nr:biotin/lipoyl-binding protein [SAR324 cluster bacterium]
MIEKANEFNKAKIFPFIILGLLVLLAGLIIFRFYRQKDNNSKPDQKNRPVPVEIADVKRGSIEQRRTFSGTLEANAQIIVTPKVSGRVENFNVNLADIVTKGQIVAVLDNAEYIQAVVQAQADLAVARANLQQAETLLIISRRELDRTKKLRDRKFGSEAAYDSVKADYQVKKTQLEIAKANMIGAESALKTTRIHLSYTQIKADPLGRV